MQLLGAATAAPRRRWRAGAACSLASVSLARPWKNEEVNELIKSDSVVGDWLASLTRVSAKLYERDTAAWSTFEPARKQVTESLSWLAFEGEVDLAKSNVTDAIAVLDRRLPKAAQQWRSVAAVAHAALGRLMLRELLGS
jgi:hypothetical protein